MRGIILFVSLFWIVCTVFWIAQCVWLAIKHHNSEGVSRFYVSLTEKPSLMGKICEMRVYEKRKFRNRLHCFMRLVQCGRFRLFKGIFDD